jgi:hypothetical protein
MGVTSVDQIVQAVQHSDSVELSEDKASLRVKKLENLPEFKPKKKVDSEKEPQQVNPYENLEV